MFKQDVDQVLKCWTVKRQSTPNVWAVKMAADVQSDFWEQVELAFPQEQQMVAGKNVPPVNARDLCTLQDEKWVNDAVIACCLALTCQRSQNQLLGKPADPQNQARIIFCETLLVQKIVQAHQEVDRADTPADATISLGRWSMKNCDVASVMQAEKIIVPVHVGSNHWLHSWPSSQGCRPPA